jgi:3-dehydroquinate synthase
MTKTVLTVGLENRAYDITIGPGLIDQTSDLLGEIATDRHIIVVSDNHVAPLHMQRLCDSLLPMSRQLNQFVVAAGEATKSMAVLTRLLNDILAVGIDRSVLLIAFGGGVIGDLTGFAAACLLRGVDYVQIPTSLLAQVDSSVGGKTGVNSKAGKNLIGAFHQPRAVLADTSLLATLPERELRAGYAEVVKYGLLGDSEFFSWLETKGEQDLALMPEALEHAIHTSCSAKAQIVEADELEAGNRALLNLGHTFGHAFEAVANYDGRLLHGEAVAAGMGLALDLSVELGLCPKQDAARCKNHLHQSGLPSSHINLPAGNASAYILLGHMKHDKKTRNGIMHFILTRSIGDAFVHANVPEEIVTKLLERGSDAV